MVKVSELLDEDLLLVTDVTHIQHVCLSVEHGASSLSWPTAAVHRAPAAGGLEVESSWRPSPWHRYIPAEKCLLQLSRVCELQLKYPCVCLKQIFPCRLALLSRRLTPPNLTLQSFCGTWTKGRLFLCRYNPLFHASCSVSLHFHIKQVLWWHRVLLSPPAHLVHPQVHCISTEFTPRKHGGEKGVPFRIQLDTFAQGDGGEYTEHLHSASCQIKVFKVRTQSLTENTVGVFMAASQL